jgi:hypothetical protein
MGLPVLPEETGMLLQRGEMYTEAAFPGEVVSVEFKFEEGRFRVTVVPDDDTLDTAWLTTTGGNSEDRDLVPLPREFWASFVGMGVLHWRIMTNHRGYSDALEMELVTRTGDHLKRFVRIEAISSRLQIQEMVAVRTTDSAR